MAELMAKASFTEKKHTTRYHVETLEFEEKEAKSKAKFKVFEELEQPTTASKIPFLPSRNGKQFNGKQFKLIATRVFHHEIHYVKGVLTQRDTYKEF